MDKARNTLAAPADAPAHAVKKPYQPPVLTLFGEVAVLTRSTSCSSTNDNAGSCPSAGGTSMGLISDRRLKQDIVSIGAHPWGFGLYLFRYLPAHRDSWGHGRQFGVMADEVERVMPEAVATRPDGYSMVHYGMIGITPALH
jgi:hypothetical protein